MAFTVTMTAAPARTLGGPPDADSVSVEEGHLVLRAHRAVGIYAPGKWHSVVEVKARRWRPRAALVSDVPA